MKVFPLSPWDGFTMPTRRAAAFLSALLKVGKKPPALRTSNAQPAFGLLFCHSPHFAEVIWFTSDAQLPASQRIDIGGWKTIIILSM